MKMIGGWMVRIWVRDAWRWPILTIAATVAFVPALTAIVPVVAQTVLSQKAKLEQVALDASKIEKFLETWSLISAEIEQRDSDFDAADTETLVEQLTQLAETAATDPALDTIVKEHGYASFRMWIATSYAILVARYWVENPPDHEEFAKAREAIEKMEDMSEDQKREMLDGLQDALGVVSAMEPSADNRQAVEPYLREIAAVLEPDGEKID
jgi:hypothetical protein